MKKYLWLILILFSFIASYKVFADEVEQKTDGSFVGGKPPKSINSSFVGDISNSMVNESWGKEDLQKKTDSTFVGEGTINSENSYFAGDYSDKEEQKETDTPFAGDGTFVGNNYGK